MDKTLSRSGDLGTQGRAFHMWLAWSACGLVFAVISCTLALFYLNRVSLIEAGLPVLGVAGAIVGALIASRQPRNPVGWIFLGSAFFGSLRTLLGEYAVYGITTSPGSVPLAEVAAGLSIAIRMPGPVLGFVLLPLFFPNGKPPSRRWNIVMWLVAATFLPVVLFDALSPGVAVYMTGIRNPFGIEALAPYTQRFGSVLLVWFVGLIFAAAASLVVRFRNTSGIERQQIKWLTLAAAVIPVWFAVNAPIQHAFPLAFSVVDSLIIAGVPVAAGIAILRYRLYDIDLIINRALVYTVLTVLLGLVYFAAIAAFQWLFGILIGGESQFAVVASTLAIAALFSPVRRGVQSFIDRRFYRKKYDARRTLEEFSTRLRNETDLDELVEDLTAVARKTMQPAHVSLWLRPDGAREKASGFPEKDSS